MAINYSTNYWHFIFTILDKIISFEENGFKGNYIVPNRKYIKELLALTNIPAERFIFFDGTHSTYSVKKLHVIDYCYLGEPYQSSFANPETMQKIKKIILSNINLSDIGNYPKKLFVKRIGVRKIKNEPEVENFLKKYNFQTMIPEDYSVEEQIKFFYAADVIVCAHGANSTNALFMKENTHFIECFGDRYVNPCMFDIIKRNKLNYHMIAERVHGDIGLGIAPSMRDYHVDLVHLDCILYNLV